ncbi:sarcosine oxidase subunit gamma [Roseovarius sp. M141]|uniref:sarcosine oxidase subunit gamma n=1 Tax=Roseovarius sp. M141 TaxID=2583806 RepID=UPI0020CE3A82|nr:hypothetical protein [Roseovarius sp. M141]MCQ0092702.1 sarcosine oxidase subunit gamma [Roseovarius sp. M141]
MAEPVSALRETLSPGTYGQGAAGVSMREIPRFSLIQIAAWPGTLETVGRTVAQHLQAAGAPAPGRSTLAGSTLMMRIEPLKYWLLSQGAAPDLPHIDADQGAVLDLSHARCWLRLGGPKAETLLNHYLPLDLRDAAFAEAVVAASAMHHVSVTLWRSGADFNLLLPRSFAATLGELLSESAQQYGLSVD